MRPGKQMRRLWFTAGIVLFLAGLLVAQCVAAAEPGSPNLPAITSVRQLHQQMSTQGKFAGALRLEGTIRATVSNPNYFVLQDDSGAEWIQLDSPHQSLLPGSHVSLASDRAWIVRTEIGAYIGPLPLIDNDGVHGMVTRSNRLELAAGQHPLRLQWFNYNGPLGLKLAYEGPGIPQQIIPAASMSSERSPVPGSRFGSPRGVKFACYEGTWTELPDFSSLRPVKTGLTPQITTEVKTRADGVALVFNGFLQVPQSGAYWFYLTSDDGSRLYVNETAPALQRVDTPIAVKPLVNVYQFELPLMQGSDESEWAMVEGNVVFASEQTNGMEIELQCGIDPVRALVLDGSSLVGKLRRHQRVRLTGVCQNVRSADGRWVFGRVIVPSAAMASILDSSSSQPRKNALLGDARQVQSLKREDALRGLPARIRGTVTCTALWSTAAIVQDDTRGIYVDELAPLLVSSPQLGEFLEIEGVTSAGDFSPTIIAKKAIRRGAGRLPEPVHPSWDQLMNGSLDAQYVEIQGIITSLNSNHCTLLIPGGTLAMEFQCLPDRLEPLARCLKRLVRLRGCLLAVWGSNRLVQPGSIRLGDPSFSLEDQTVEDPFAIPTKRVAELRTFDYQASALQRIQIAGHIVYLHENEGCLMDESNGVRFALSEPADLRPGDLAQIVGYPELGGASPVLREALARKTGAAPLPAAQDLTPDDLWRDGLDATRVRIEGVLVFQQRGAKEHILQLQTGVWSFNARMPGAAELPALPEGSRLALTGVYSIQGAKQASGRKNPVFELCLEKPADIEVLARPPWWTVARILGAAGAIGLVLMSGVVWAFTLRRKVRAQTQIIRQKLQHEATLEERTRLAREFHDTLEQALAGIGMQLNALAGQARQLAPETRRILDMTCSMVRHSQEEARRSVQDLRSFDLEKGGLAAALAKLATRPQEGSGTQIHFEYTGAARALSSRKEMHLFRISQEALSNALKHAAAANIRMSLEYGPNSLILSIRDDGRGFDTQKATASEQGHFGLLGMRERAEKAGGQLRITSSPGQGTAVEVCVPLLSFAQKETSL